MRWFGLIYPYFAVLFLAWGIFFYKNLDTAYMNKVDPSVQDSANVFMDVKMAKGRTVEGANIAELANPTDEMVKKGAELFKGNCASCHGEQGNGDGPAGAALNPKPRNFHAENGWKNGRNLPGMFKTLTQGIPGSAMPAYEYMPAGDRFALIHYVSSLAKNIPKPSENDLAQLDQQFNISQGSQVPSQIPVSLAMEKLQQEALPEIQNIYDVVSNINNNPDSPGARIFNKVSRDKVRTLSYLSKTAQWKGSLDDFIKTVNSSLNVNGFGAGAATLSATEWSELYNYLKALNLSER